MSLTYAFTIKPSSHAKLSASSADRWLACPGSIKLSEGLPLSPSVYAAQGTAAHYIAAECQQMGNSPRRYLGKAAMVEGFPIVLDEDLIAAVEDFLAYIKANEVKGDRNWVEQSFSTAMKKLHPDFGGTSDRVMWRESEKLLRVYDYKHGAGVVVDVVDSRQLKYYALGVLLQMGFNAAKIELVIAQPRIEHEQGRFRKWSFDAIDLLDYAAELVEGAEATMKPDAPFVAGKKQCQWCPARAICPELEKQSHALVAVEFDVTIAYDPDKLAAALKLIPMVEARIEAIREFAYAEAERGKTIPGFKLVAKKANRSWKSEDEVKQVLIMKPDYFTPAKLKSPAQIEKILGKKEFEKILAPLVEKISSGHTLAPMSDPREPVKLLTVDDFETVVEPKE